MSDPRDNFRKKKQEQKKKKKPDASDNGVTTNQEPKSKTRKEIRKEQSGQKKGRRDIPIGKQKGPRPYMRR